MDLTKLVRAKIEKLGVKAASLYFGVSLGTVSNWMSGKTYPSVSAAQLVLDEAEGVIAAPSVLPEELTMWEGRQLHLLLPVYKTFHPNTHFTLFRNYALYGPSKIALTMEVGTQIHEARNLLVHKARKANAEKKTKYVLFGDDDMIFPCGSAEMMNGRFGGNLPEPSASMLAFSRIMSHPEECKIVGALYFGRNRFGPAQCNRGFAKGHEQENIKLRRHEYKQLITDHWVAPGFMRIHMDVFDALESAIKEGKFPECVPNGDDRPLGFFNPMKAGMGEDVSFGIRCRDIGIQSWLDPVLECLHMGSMAFGSHNTSNRPNM